MNYVKMLIWAVVIASFVGSIGYIVYTLGTNLTFFMGWIQSEHGFGAIGTYPVFRLLEWIPYKTIGGLVVAMGTIRIARYLLDNWA